MTDHARAAAEALAFQRKLVRRSKAQGRRWFLRAILLAVIAGIAFVRGGSLNLTIGAAMAVVAAAALGMGVQMRRQARALEEKIDLMEHTSSEALGELSG